MIIVKQWRNVNSNESFCKAHYFKSDKFVKSSPTLPIEALGLLHLNHKLVIKVDVLTKNDLNLCTMGS